MSYPHVTEGAYRCVSDAYDPDGGEYGSSAAFLDMCRECFPGEPMPKLHEDGGCYYVVGSDWPHDTGRELVLVPMAAEDAS